MLNTIVKAAENFCIHQIRVPYNINDKLIIEKNIQTAINIKTDIQKYTIYITYNFNFAQKLALLLLEEEESDEETLIDMALESTNLIVGSAKVLVQENQDQFNIETPYLLEVALSQEPQDQYKTITFENNMMIIGIKALEND